LNQLFFCSVFLQQSRAECSVSLLSSGAEAYTDKSFVPTFTVADFKEGVDK